MSIARWFSRACRIATVPLVLAAAGAPAQSAVRPMSTLRLTIGNAEATVRIVRSDSDSLVVENPGGERRTIARADITSLERRGGHAKRGALAVGAVGVVLGAAFGALLVEGLCETSSCSDDIVPAMFAMGGIFGGIGAAGGAVLGHLAGGWRPIERDVRVRETIPVAVCLGNPRVEMRFVRTQVQGSGHRQINAGVVCGSGTVIGVESGNVSDEWYENGREVADARFGVVATSTYGTGSHSYRGGFLEHPLTTGRLRLSALGGYGEYVSHSRWSESSNLKTSVGNFDYQTFYEAYPARYGWSQTRERGASVGAKASMALGIRMSAGLTARLQRAGTDKQTIESGLALSFRP
jgi:hypothetical protein